MNILQVTNPRTGENDYHIPEHDRAHVARSAAELRTAQKAWKDAGLAYRCEVMGKWRQAIEKHSEAISAALCIDTGRQLMSQIETSGVIQRIEYCRRRAPEILAQPAAATSVMVPSVSFKHNLVPYPVVGVISPWNFPLTLALIDTIPALLAGCSVLLKPSEITPRFAEPLMKTLQEVPELQSVLSIVNGGADTGMALIDNVDAICFTGSVMTGRKVAIQAAQNFIPAFLELGGKDAAIVLKSADLENAATAILRSAAGMTGQACQSLERIYVQHDVFAGFLELLIAKAKRIRINFPDINEGQIGPFIFPDQAQKVSEQLRDAIAHGAKIHCGGDVQELDGGWYCLPTVITGVSQDMLLMQEETFGPILPVMPFDETEQAIAMANDSDFGLSGAVFAGNREEGEVVARQIIAGAISINDASLTGMANDVEKNSFCLSGIGGSRMGDQGFLRFFRKQAIMYQSEPAASLEIFDESHAG